MADLMQCKKENIRVIYENVQKQRGASDCGYFAVAFATILCYGKSPSSESYCQRAMREHLINAFDTMHLIRGKLTTFLQMQNADQGSQRFNAFQSTVFAA